MIRFLGFLSEMCSFLVLGMISFNIHPFDIDKRALLLFVFIVYLSRYAAVTGVMDTVVKWMEPHRTLLTHNHVTVFSMVYM